MVTASSCKMAPFWHKNYRYLFVSV